MRSIPSIVLKAPIVAYRVAISPLLGQNCRFYPSCSAYALDAITKFGALKGSWLAIKRLGCCHPWHPGGYDPVPEPSHAACCPQDGSTPMKSLRHG